MNNFIVETNTIYVYEGEELINCYVITSTELEMILEEKCQNETRRIKSFGVTDTILSKEMDKVVEKLKSTKLQYETEVLMSMLDAKDIVNLEEFGDIQTKIKRIGKYTIKIVRAYYNPKGQLFDGLTSLKWPIKKKKE